ncbi:hypothetical protein JKP88DRAFT_253977 [Tribonema minus]|uniref:Uncharacterized protein n=1 Tax=Tribonema minus TaxID=303371 RepID=A0A835Z4T0_9STRA|nr:hypothetical protein JKP88DRAFT_253977 [Tribonema minus]
MLACDATSRMFAVRIRSFKLNRLRAMLHAPNVASRMLWIATGIELMSCIQLTIVIIARPRLRFARLPCRHHWHQRRAPEHARDRIHALSHLDSGVITNTGGQRARVPLLRVATTNSQLLGGVAVGAVSADDGTQKGATSCGSGVCTVNQFQLLLDSVGYLRNGHVQGAHWHEEKMWYVTVIVYDDDDSHG